MKTLVKDDLTVCIKRATKAEKGIRILISIRILIEHSCQKELNLAVAEGTEASRKKSRKGERSCSSVLLFSSATAQYPRLDIL